MSHEVFLGAAGWVQATWIGPFYPPEMPEAWRPAYFALHLSCVWLPHADWQALKPVSAREQTGDIREGFRFLLDAGEAEAEELRAALGGARTFRCRADDPDMLWFEDGVDLRDLAGKLRRRTAVPGHTYLLSRDGDLATLQQVGQLLDLMNLGPGGRVG